MRALSRASYAPIRRIMQQPSSKKSTHREKGVYNIGT